MKALLWLGAVGLLLLAGMPFPVILALGVILYGIVFALAVAVARSSSSRSPSRSRAAREPFRGASGTESGKPRST